jgi:competence protein ComEC
MKKLLILVFTFVFIMNAIPVQAVEPIKVFVNGSQVQFDVQPTIENGRTLVPIAAIYKALGADVRWDGAARTVTGTRGYDSVVLKIDSRNAIVNEESRLLDVPATIRSGRTLVPLAFVSQSLGCIVKWDGTTRTVTIRDAGLRVSFLDVGQADSILVQTPGNKVMLIDAGNNEDGDDVSLYLKKRGITKIDVLVGTHPHEDHIGGMDTVIEDFDIGTVYMPKVLSTTQTFEDVLNALSDKGLVIEAAAAGKEVALDPALDIQMLAPNSDTYDDTNNYSAVLKLKYNNASFLLEGDAEDVSESEMLAGGYDLKADVLKVGHHGSSSSTTQAYLDAVAPKYAVISAGKENSYGHPTQATLNRLTAAKAQVYRTDLLGTITAVSDGNFIAFDKNITAPVPTVTPAPTVTPRPTVTPGPTPTPVPVSTVNRSIVISSINLAGEAVTITNKSAQNTDMTGWKLVSVKGNQTFTFPNGYILKAGASVKITSGPNATGNGGSILEWTTANVWNNDGDPGKLYDARGNLNSSK